MGITSSTLPTAPAVVREQPGGESMRAIILDGFGGLDRLVYTEIPKPLPRDGEVVIQVKGFGINHAELHMRRGEWAEAAEVSGIECVGIVDSCPGGEFPVGTKVAALMGGLGRTINGSYAQHTRVRAANVAPIDSELPWSQLAPAGNRCGGLDVSVPQPQPAGGTDAAAARGDLVVRPGSTQDGGRRRRARHRDRPQQPAGFGARGTGCIARRSGKARPRLPHRRIQANRRRVGLGGVTAPSSTRSTCCAAAGRPAWPAGWAGLIP